MSGIVADIKVDTAGFLASLPAAVEEWNLQAFEFIEHVAEEAVDKARELVAKRTGKLASTIGRGPLVVSRKGAFVEVRAGDGTRYAIYQEFGTSKMAAHPYFRPALALAAGGARGAGYAARTASTSKSRAAARRSLHRAKLRRAVKAGLLTSKEARQESRRISAIRRFRG
jgi:HK97 gp10 family phage protein